MVSDGASGRSCGALAGRAGLVAEVVHASVSALCGGRGRRPGGSCLARAGVSGNGLRTAWPRLSLLLMQSPKVLMMSRLPSYPVYWALGTLPWGQPPRLLAPVALARSPDRLLALHRAGAPVSHSSSPTPHSPRLLYNRDLVSAMLGAFCPISPPSSLPMCIHLIRALFPAQWPAVSLFPLYMERPV